VAKGGGKGERAMRIGIGLAAAMLLWCGTGPRAAPAADDFWSGAAKPAPTKLEPPAVPARPTLADLDAFERATAELWLRLPFGARRNLLVSRKAEAFGDYEARPSSVFKPGEALITYVEPVGYGWVPVGTDLHRLGVTVDFEITTPAGKVLGGQNGFLDYGLTSHARVLELFINLTLTLDEIAQGDYVLVFTLHDKASGRSARVPQPFTIKG
jgi:hypothetical protein